MDSYISAARAIAEEDASLGASRAVEEPLLAEVRAIGRARRQRLLMFTAAAAVLLMAVAVPVRHVLVERQTQKPSQPAGAPLAAADNVTEFFSLGFADVPVSGAQIVRIEVPSSALRSFGVVQIAAPGHVGSSKALADVIVGDDGLARAVRFVGAKRVEGPVR